VLGANSSEEGLASYRAERPDVIILDLSLNGRDGGLDVLREVRKHDRNTRVIVFSAYDDLERTRRAIELGADGYLLKDASSEEFGRAFDRVAAGKRYMSEDLAQRLALEAAVKPAWPPALSDEERDILKLLADGRSHSSIAFKLRMSMETVATIANNLKAKLAGAG
jgi:DNA-binding NarL/FixJ family response regulator